ncbi:WD40/YVTN/BNR-like repeat-containing protein [Gracilibacillus alcaliphilus]|uniref:WD40/YVTN/BNR-like repeat-containing protein n=1 Tax=Gracilibacillus alcaliphilus TaxID=1401441 RepID=UPI00195C74A3|nr:oxidoreductase [Gracilibacillus alcaliphilus]MBM7678311.1 photosystem II stability/assembly factor-like uncharacterized protein [Gracilibacillus alcaliphilus]
MKYLLISIASVMVVAIMITAIIYYQEPTQVSLPEQPISEESDYADLVPQAVEVEDVISYSLQGDTLTVTFNKGKDWITVPVEKELLFTGEYSGNQQQLIEQSYLLSEERAAFLYAEQSDTGPQNILLISTTDQGKSWEKSLVVEQFPPLRFRKVDFVDDSFGYVILSGDRTMSQEYSSIFLSYDGGETWEEVNRPDVTRLVADGGFVDEQTGFVSFGILNPEEPSLYRTQDGGQNWQEAVFEMPDQYLPVFVQAEMPVKEDDHLTVLVNQGSSGDYDGGLVKGKFISEDQGETWQFVEEVEPDE